MCKSTVGRGFSAKYQTACDQRGKHRVGGGGGGLESVLRKWV